MIFTCLLLALLLLPVPVLVGSLFEKVNKNLIFRWICGQLCLWAIFLLISVPIILKAPEGSFRWVCLCNLIVTGLLAIAGAGKLLAGRSKQQTAKAAKEKMPAAVAAIWCAAGALLLLQLVLTVVLAYEEGDDAFYVAVSTITQESGTMYQVLPYTGGSTGLDARHSLAPFPVWIAMLAKVSGLHAATVAQIAAPLVLIVMAYGIFYLFAAELFDGDRKKTGIFLLLLELLVLFGGQSLYTAENFLLVRTAQGKAVLANIVIPFTFYLLFLLFEKLQAGEKKSPLLWVLLTITMMAGCLCSTQGALLTCVLVGVGIGCSAIAYRKWNLILPGLCSCVIPVGMAVLYLLLG